MSLYRVLVFALAICLGVGAASLAGSSIAGKWKMEISSGGQKRVAILYIEEKDGELSGTWGNNHGGQAELQALKFRQGILTFWFELDTGSAKRKMTYTGLLRGSELSGQLKSPRSASRVVGKRMRDRPADGAETP